MNLGPRLAVIGAGAWGRNHVRLLAAEPGCELVAVVDSDAATRRRVGELAPNALFCMDVERVLTDRGIDGVVISTPAGTHVDLVCMALQAGKHVLVEKPLSLSSAAYHRVSAIAPRSVTMMVGHQMVFHPAVELLKDLLRSGSLGRLHGVQGTRANLGRLRTEENALWSLGPHELSMLDYLMDCAPVSVAARGQCVLQKGIEDVVFMTLRYPDGEMAHLHLSWLHPRKERRLTLLCSDKMVEFDDMATDKLRIFDKGYDRRPTSSGLSGDFVLRDNDVQIPEIAPAEPLQRQLQHFLRCIESGDQPRTNLRSACRVVDILEAAQRSLAADGTPMTLTA